MAEDNSQKTQEPSDKKLQDARDKGDVPTAPEMRHAVMFLAALLIVGTLGIHAAQSLAGIMAGWWRQAGSHRLSAANAPEVADTALLSTLGAVGPILLTTLILALSSMFLAGRPSLSLSRLKLKWDKLNPAKGLNRLLGKQAWVEFAKTLFKFALVGTVIAFVAWPSMAGLDHMVGADAMSIGNAAAALVARMVTVAFAIVLVLALADLIYQRRAWFAKMRMSLQELKDEHKEAEGDPQIKQRQRSIAMARARNRMMAAVPGAAVVITNPTHYSVALKYDHGAMGAPIVVAKGVDAIAFRIREVAREHGVPVLESPPLARALHASVDIDQPIPVEHYAAVAEIISYVLRLTREKAARGL